MITMEDPKIVSHPDHYQSEKGLEVIDVIDAFTEGLVGIEAVNTGNILKYICRWKKKNGLEDLLKARWYLNDLIERVRASGEQIEFVETEPGHWEINTEFDDTIAILKK